uniref:Uncharacterized protein n=1 Tax=Anguilla anguilla TaxID=7936 RepID=A0A0E9PNJ1_ANGAN
MKSLPFLTELILIFFLMILCCLYILCNQKPIFVGPDAPHKLVSQVDP